MLITASHRLHGEAPVSAEPHHAAGKDRSVTPRQIQLVGGLLVELRGKPFPNCAFLALIEHILRVIAAVHVQAFREVWQEQSTAAAAKV